MMVRRGQVFQGLVSSLWCGCSMAMSTEAFSSGVTPKMAQHYLQLKKLKEMQGAEMDTVELQKRNSPLSEEDLCGRFGVRELRPFQRDVLQQLGVLGSTHRCCRVLPSHPLARPPAHAPSLPPSPPFLAAPQPTYCSPAPPRHAGPT